MKESHQWSSVFVKIQHHWWSCFSPALCLQVNYRIQLLHWRSQYRNKIPWMMWRWKLEGCRNETSWMKRVLHLEWCFCMQTSSMKWGFILKAVFACKLSEWSEGFILKASLPLHLHATFLNCVRASFWRLNEARASFWRLNEARASFWRLNKARASFWRLNEVRASFRRPHFHCICMQTMWCHRMLQKFFPQSLWAGKA